MDLELKNVHCCGIKDVKGMNSGTPWSGEGFMKLLVVKSQSFNEPHLGNTKYAGYAHYTFSYAYDTINTKGGFRSQKQAEYRFRVLRKYIEKHGLGDFYVTKEQPSPVYGGKHTIIAGIFTPDTEALMAHARKKKWVKAKADTMPHHATVWV